MCGEIEHERRWFGWIKELSASRSIGRRVLEAWLMLTVLKLLRFL